MKRKGFTLIELLAVIVILAIIATIAIPTLLKVVEKSKKSAAGTSALGYIDAIEKAIVLNPMRGLEEIKDGNYELPMDDKYSVKVKGSKPSSGTIVIEKGKVISAELIINGYRVVCDNRICRSSGKADQITITYDTDGGTLSKQKDIIYKNETLVLPVPEKENYGFIGWYIGDTKVNNETVFKNDTTLKAKYKKNRFTVVFNAGDGSISESSRIVNYNDTIDLPTPESPTNYSFIGWYTESNCQGNEMTNSTPIVDNLDLYACYVKTVTDFAYTGTEQTFIVPATGKYKLEVWGAQGGNVSGMVNYTGAVGGYSIGKINLEKNTTIYTVVGGQGISLSNGNVVSISETGYNGGGRNSSQSSLQYYGSGGGGATHMALDSGLLSELSSHATDGRILIVAGGGGGSSTSLTTVNNVSTNGVGGTGGGFKGTKGSTTYVGTAIRTPGDGGTQTSAGASYSTVSAYTGATFGKGCSPVGSYDSTGYMRVSGGGGYYGGGCGIHSGGGGGSGYIANSSLTDKKMVCYNCTTSTAEATKTESNTCHNSTPTADCSKEGNGYAKITYLGK